MALDRNKIVFSIIFVAVLTFFSFSSTLDSEFTNWDDQKYVTENHVIKEISWDRLKTIFTDFYTEAYSQPLVILSFAIEYYFFKLNPFIYHLTNLILHTLSSVLVFCLVFIFSRKISISLITALFFGIHPLHVESVAWVSERKDVLSIFFFLQSLIFYLLHKERNKWFYYYLSVFVLVLSLFSKAMGVTLPFILLLFDYLSGRRFDRKALLEKVPFFAVSGLFVVMNLYIFYSAGAIISTKVFSHYDNVLIACRSLVFYLIKVLLPINLSAFYPYPTEISIFQPDFFLSLVVLIILVALVWYSRKYTRKIIFGSLFFLLTILPVIKLVPFGGGGAAMADRYMYIPSIGLFYVAGVAFYKAFQWDDVSLGSVRKLTVLLLCLVVLFFSFLSYKRGDVWQKSETLWLNVIKNYPDVSLAHNNL